MKKLLSALTVLLVLQLALAAGLYYQQPATAEPAGKLLHFKPNQVSQIELTAGKDQLTLRQHNGQWTLPGKAQLPAAGSRITQLLQTLSTTADSIPLATSETAHQRFNVAKDDYRVHLELKDSQQHPLADLYIGAGAGQGRAYVRKAGDSGIHAVAIDSYALSADSKAWLDTGLLAVPQVDSITGGDFRLEKKDKAWTLVRPQNTVADQGKAATLATRFENLHVISLVEGLSSNQADQRFTVSANGNSYTFYLQRQGKLYLLRRDDRPQWFRINEETYKALASTDGNALKAGK